MFNKTFKVFQYFQNTGIDDSYDVKEKLRIQTSNEIIFFTFVIIILKIFYNIATSAEFYRMAVLFVWGGIFGLSHILAKQKKHQSARILIISIIILFMIALQVFIGHKNIQLEPLYAVLVYFIILFYERKIQNILIPALCLTYLGISYINYIYPPPYADVFPPSSQLIHTTILIAFFFYIVRRNMIMNAKNGENLKRQQEKLILNNKQLGQFNYIVSHDLKEPVRSIVSFASLLKRSKNDESKKQEFTKFIVRSGYQLYNLIDGIQEYQELTDMKLSYQKIDLNKVLDDAKLELDSKIKKKNVIIKSEILPHFRTADYPLFVVFKKLIENAIRFNNNDVPRIYIWSEEMDDLLNIYFKDNGIGIEEEYHEAIFQMFKRLGTDKAKSPGIGLNLCLRVIQKLDGTLKIDQSIVGRGTTFCISLPLEKKKVKLPSQEMSLVE